MSEPFGPQAKHMVIGRVTVEKVNEQVNNHEGRISRLESLVEELSNPGIVLPVGGEILFLDESESDTLAFLEDENNELATRILELEEEIAFLRSQRA